PGVGGAVDVDEGPGMVFVDEAVGRVGNSGVVVGVAAQVLDADVVEPPGGGELVDRPAAVLLIQCLRDRRVDGDGVAVDAGDGALHVDVARAGRPRVVQQVHPQRVDPVLRAGAVDDDRIPHRQAGGAVHREADRAGGDVLVGDVVGGVGDGRARSAAVDLDNGALARSGGVEDGAGDAGAAQHHAAGGNR